MFTYILLRYASDVVIGKISKVNFMEENGIVNAHLLSTSGGVETVRILI